MAGRTYLAATGLTLILVLVKQCFARDAWMTGSATAWSFPGDQWTINSGHCGYADLDKKFCTGYDVVALSDHFPGFNKRTANCGKCYEIRCNPALLTDNFGNKVDRRISCYPGMGSVVVQVADVGPCKYGGVSAVNNAKWFCPGRTTGTTKNKKAVVHVDLSYYTFEKLAPTYHGVIGIQIRPVSCKYKPVISAKIPNGGKPSKDPTKWHLPRQHKRPCPSRGPKPKCTLPVKLPKCVDVNTPGFSCKQQRNFKACRKDFMMTGGYFCRKTCQIDHCLPSYVARYPPGVCLEKSIGRAPPKRKCVDDAPVTRKDFWTCKLVKKRGECNRPWVRDANFCRKTCGKCGGRRPRRPR